MQWYLLPKGPGPGPGTGTDTWGHSATELDGFSSPLFDSGTLDPSGSYAHLFSAAGIYTVRDETTNLEQTVQVGLKAEPSSGTHTTVFTITWASQPAPAGFVFDVQLQKPGGQWTDWSAGTTTPSGTFTPAPSDPSGMYGFRARLRASPGAGKTGYSKATQITVS